MISRTITTYIEKEIDALQEQLVDDGKEELQDTEIIFEKMKRVPNYTDDEIEDEKSKRYTFLAKNLIDKIEGLRAEIDPKEFDPLNIRENLKKIIDMENIRNRGFNTAINSITAILDTSKMGYQYIENLKNARELVLREYEDVDVTNLPDERYQIRLKYYDAEQLTKEQEAYDKQMEAFKNEIFHLRDVVEVIYQNNKHSFKVNDFEDLSRKVAGSIKKSKKDSTDPLYEEIEKTWNKITTIKAELTDVERLNQTYLYEKTLYKKMLGVLQKKVSVIYGYQNPQVRVILDNEIGFVAKEFEAFDYLINPYHIQPGLLLDVDITSIKRKRYTMMAMANVLNEFLSAVSKGFQDAAFATFKRRRSTVRADLNQSFANEEEPVVSELPKGPEAFASEPEAGGEEVKGKADVTPAPSSKRRGSSSDGLAEL
jgi:hypothetical protein